MSQNYTLIQKSIHPLFNKYLSFIEKKSGRRLVTSIILGLTLFFGYGISLLSVDFEFEKFFPKNHPESIKYETHKAQFGYDNDFLQIILEAKNGLYNSEFLEKAKAFETDIRQIKGVTNSYSILSLRHVIKSPTGILIYPLLHIGNDSKLKEDSVRVSNNAFYSSSISNSTDAVIIYLKHKHFKDQERGNEMVTQINSFAEKNGLKKIRIIGKIVAANEFIELINQDFIKFLIGSIMISIVVLTILFKGIKDALLPFIISLLSIIWLFGLMGWIGMKINLLSSLIPPILFFVSMSDAIHFLNTLKKTASTSARHRLRYAIEIVWTPTLLTSITTAIGFLSLLWITTIPVQELGIFAAIGVLIALILTYSFGICYYLYFPTYSISRSDSWEAHYPSIIKNKKSLPSLVLFILLLTPGIVFLHVNAYLLDDLPRYSQTRLDFEFADQHFGGSKPYEIRIEPKDSSHTIWSKPVMDEIVKLEDLMVDSFMVARVQSPATIIKFLHQVNNGGLNKYFKYPESSKDFEKTLQTKRRIDPSRLDELVTKDSKVGRIIGFIPEIGSRATQQKNEKLLTLLKDNVDQDIISYNITGTTYLIDKSHEILSLNLCKGLLTAIVIIGIILGIYFRSIKLVFISMIPNLIPLLIIAGVLGWLGISLKLTTSIIFTITFGIAVDDTIHMMSSYLRSDEKDPYQRMMYTMKHAGNAMIITTIVMISGFFIYLFSSFSATFYMGLFVCLSLVLALIVDLVLLPKLLINYTKNNNAKKRRLNS